MELTFPNDVKFRKKRFTPECFAHPAKMNCLMLLWIVGKYTKHGEVILDPMAGIGTTMLGCSLGRDVVLVELEEKFCKMAEANRDKMCRDGWMIGDCQIIQGDARNLQGLLVDGCIFSPPYAETNIEKEKQWWLGREKARGRNPDQVASGKQVFPSQENKKSIGNLPYGLIDKIVTSPPYENQIHKGTGEWSQSLDGRLLGGEQSFGGKMLGVPQGAEYIKSADNIGNLKSQSYLSAMLQVYQSCLGVLKPQGLMILVTKNFIRKKQVIRLDLDTISLCEQAGFKLVERHKRKLTQQSFWRVIYYQKHPEVEKIEHEDILVLRKEGNGGVVDKIVTSPPYSIGDKNICHTKEGKTLADYDKARGYKVTQHPTTDVSKDPNNIANLPYGKLEEC